MRDEIIRGSPSHCVQTLLESLRKSINASPSGAFAEKWVGREHSCNLLRAKVNGRYHRCRSNLNASLESEYRWLHGHNA